MGLSSSQARLLNLTTRMHQIEYKAAKLEAEKLQMANESRRVYTDYQNALEATKLQHSTINTDGSIGYVDATYSNLKEMGYDIRYEGKAIIDSTTEANLKTAGDNKDYFIALQSGRVTTDNQDVNGVTEVYTADQLMNMQAGKSYRLMSDIDLTGKDWTSKTLTTGCTFDGNGHTIKGLNKALFSNVTGTVENLNIEGNSTSRALLADTAGDGTNISNVNISGTVNCSDWQSKGALVGGAIGNITISNCSANANVTGVGTETVGGLIGEFRGNGNSTIDNCQFVGNVTGRNGCGGIVSYVSGATISNCSVSVNTIAQYGYCGGIACNADNSTIKNCKAEGSTGGLVFIINNSTMENCDSYVSRGFRYINSTITNLNDFNNNANAYYEGWAGTVNNYYSKYNRSFAQGMGNDTTVTTTTTANNNVITVTPPTVQQTTFVEDENNKYGKFFDDINQNGYITEEDFNKILSGHEKDTTWLTNMVNAGYLFIYSKDKSTNEYVQTSVSTDTNLQEVADETGLRKAEAKYEADMKRIDLKDRKFDYDLAAIENERNAIKQEMETLKTVAKDNVESTFKLFS